MLSRREWMIGALAAGAARAEPARPNGVLIESHLHLFAGDPDRFPYSKLAYAPKPNPVEAYVKFARELKLDHSLIVHPEPYQDDHRYLEYCFSQEPAPGFFKGTCLFDPIDPRTPARIQEIVKRNPGRIVALRIHEVHPAGTPSTTTGAIRDRDPRDPQVMKTLRAVHGLGLALQVHFIPHYAPQIAEIAAQLREMPIVLDHLARPGDGTSAEYAQVLKLADFPRVYMKFSKTGVASASKQPFPHADAKPLVQKVHAAFGAERMVWGELGNSMAEFEENLRLFELQLDFASTADRAKIRGLTAQKLFFA